MVRGQFPVAGDAVVCASGLFPSAPEAGFGRPPGTEARRRASIEVGPPGGTVVDFRSDDADEEGEADRRAALAGAHQRLDTAADALYN